MQRIIPPSRTPCAVRGVVHWNLPIGRTCTTPRSDFVLLGGISRWSSPMRTTSLSPRRTVVTSRTARELLGLPVEPHRSFTVLELRDSYFRAAKRCHPDVASQQLVVVEQGERTASGDASSSSSQDFIRLTQAYELLQQEATSATNYVATPSEEEEFRSACEQSLGLSAEIVEECKQNPGFLRWLSGRTDSAHHWRSFFSQHGGLGPRLKPRQHLSTGTGDDAIEAAAGASGRGVTRRVRLVRR